MNLFLFSNNAIFFNSHNSFQRYTIYHNTIFIMKIIRAPSIGRAHELVITTILEKGRVLQTEDAEATIEFEEVTLQVDTPLVRTISEPALTVPAKIC